MKTTVQPKFLLLKSVRNADHHEEEPPDQPPQGPITKDLLKLKEISEKLNLSTRRASVTQWKQVIEYRKSRGQYTASSKLQYLDTTAVEQVNGSDNITKDISSCNENQISDNEGTSSPLRQITTAPSNSDSKKSSKNLVSSTFARQHRSGQIDAPVVLAEGADFQITVEDYSDDTNVVVTSLKMPSHDLLSVKETQQSNPRLLDVTRNADANTDDNARYRNINQAFESIRRDLVLMRIEDNKLARKLLDIRSEMNLMRAHLCCQEHAIMLDDVTYELLEEEELTALIKACDLSNGKPDSLLANFSPLRSIGVSRMNLNSRRFSIR